MGRAAITLISAVLFLSSMAAVSAGAINVTKMIERHSDYTQFNELLTKTGLASEINNKKSVTVLALKNSNLGSILNKPADIQKRILSIHIVLDYYDPAKLNKLKSSTTLTTLFQSSGMAKDQQGFLNATPKDGKVVIGSAMKGAPQESKVDGVVAVQPYDISVLYISKPIEAPGIDSAPASAPAPSPSNANSSPATDSNSSGEEAPPKADSNGSDNQSPPPPSGAGKLVSGLAFGLTAVLASLLAA